MFAFHFIQPAPRNMNWKGRTLWATIDRLSRPVLGLDASRIGKAVVRLAHVDSLKVGAEWQRAALQIDGVKNVVHAADAEIEEILSDPPPGVRVRGRKH